MLSYLTTICFYMLSLFITTSCNLVDPLLPLWGKPQRCGVPTGRAANDPPAPRCQGAKAMADIPLVALASAHQLLVAARNHTPGVLGIGRHPTEDPFLELRETCGGHPGPRLAGGERETGRRHPQGDKILLLDGGKRSRQLALRANFADQHPGEFRQHHEGRRALGGLLVPPRQE